MARLPRFIVPGQPLHVVQRGNNRQAVFFAVEDYRRYLEDLCVASAANGCAVHAYVLMTNHVHLLLTPDSDAGVSKMMQALGRRYVRYINATYRRSGTLWEGRFKSALVDSEFYLLTCYRYIELNPVRAGMVNMPEEYRWSSYSSNALGRPDAALEPHDVYVRLGATETDRSAAYRALFHAHLDENAVNKLRTETELGGVAGSDRFKEQITAVLLRRVSRLGHGGDRKSKDFRGQSHAMKLN